MGFPSINDLKSASAAFKAGNIEQSPISLAQDSINGLVPDNNDMFAGIMQGSLKSADVEKICQYFAAGAMNMLLPGNPINLIAAPLVGTAVGKEVSTMIPTDVTLFPLPMNVPANPANPAYASVQKSMSDTITKTENSIGMDKLPSNIGDTLKNLNYDKQPSQQQMTDAIQLMTDIIDNPMNVFVLKFPMAATLMGQLAPGLNSKLDACAAAKKQTDAIKKQQQDDVAKGKQTNLSMAAVISAVNNHLLNNLPQAIGNAIPPFKNYCQDKINSNNDPRYYTDIRNSISGLDTVKAAGNTMAKAAGDQIKSLLLEKNLFVNGFHSLRSAWTEYQQNRSLDDEKDKKDAYYAGMTGTELSPVISIRRSLITGLKFMSKVIVIMNKARNNVNPTQTVATNSLSANISEQIPDMRPDDVATFVKMVQRQIPSQNSILQNTGVDNLQFTGEKIIAQLNTLKYSLSINGLSKV